MTDFMGAARQPDWLGLVQQGMDVGRRNAELRRADASREALSSFLIEAGNRGLGAQGMQGGGAQQLATIGSAAAQGGGGLPAQSQNYATRGTAQPGSPATMKPAWQRLAQIDPVTAMSARTAQTQHETDLTKLDGERLELARSYNDAAIDAISSAVDEPSYAQAVERMAAQFEPYGIDVRAAVPAQYPGPDGMRQLMLQGLRTKDRLAALQRQDVNEWNEADDIQDNARADRNLDSAISDRAARRDLAERRETRVATKPPPARGGGAAPRQPSIAGTMAPILAKVSRGEPLTDGEQRAWNMYRPPSRGRGGAASGGGSRLSRGPIKVGTKAEYDRLAPGTEYIAPDGTTKRKAR